MLSPSGILSENHKNSQRFKVSKLSRIIADDNDEKTFDFYGPIGC
jgi:hypothetical protein